ncbi:DUF3105 domain-containing protein [Micromonospora endolithica]|nr:DUF3105 domain-containing protein [Micromonospora endolithica]TWJ21053.1 uncharacterized protein DUF3105 [Micromonospora endolithica]
MAKPNRSGARPKPRRPVAKAVAGGRSPALIATFVAVGVLAVAIIGYAIYAVTRGDGGQPAGTNIAGLTNYRASDPKMLTRNHVRGAVAYPVSPPVGGDHNPIWQDCIGDVYPAAIANENAVHSLEHGAVWITYRPDLPADQIETLAGKVRGTPYLFMSPFPGLDRPISLQAWGYQLKLDTATDPRVDQFIKDFRIKAAPEPGAPCSNGVTATGTTPHNTPGG